MSNAKLDPADAIIEFEGMDGTHVDAIDAMLKTGTVKGWLQIVVLMVDPKHVHIYPQGYGIPKDFAQQAVNLAIEWEYAKEA